MTLATEIQVGPVYLHYDLIQIYSEYNGALALSMGEIEHKLIFGTQSPFNTSNYLYRLGRELGIDLECHSNSSFTITLDPWH